MKNMKKTMAFLGVAIIASTGAVTLTACDDKEKEAATVMNLSLNPEVEFVLDENNVVLSANALNEEGNLVLSAGAFVGKSASAAAELFVDISEETGFIVKGNASLGDNKIEVSISGDTATATKLFNDVKTSISDKFAAWKLQAEVILDDRISTEDLQELVAECAPYLTAAEVRALEYMELVEVIYESRKETVDFYSQELKNAYYEAKAFAYEKAELETLKGKVSGVFSAAMDAAYSLYSSAVTEIENQRYTYLVSEESNYQKALKEFRTAKTEYLQFRSQVAEMEQNSVTEKVMEMLLNYEKVVDAKESILEGYGKAANDALDKLKTNVQTTYDSVMGVLETASVKASEHLDEISKKQKKAQEAFFTNFETQYAQAIADAKKAWADMKTELQRSTVMPIEGKVSAN